MCISSPNLVTDVSEYVFELKKSRQGEGFGEMIKSEIRLDKMIGLLGSLGDETHRPAHG